MYGESLVPWNLKPLRDDQKPSGLSDDESVRKDVPTTMGGDTEALFDRIHQMGLLHSYCSEP